MGAISSRCKRKNRDKDDAIVHHNYTQTAISTANPSPSTSSDKTRCSAMSREPTNTPSFRYHYYLPSQQQIYSTSTKQTRGHSSFPLFSTPMYLPFNDKSDASYRRSNPYVAQAYNRVIAPLPPSSSIGNTDHLRATLTTSTAAPSPVPSVSDFVQTKTDEHRAEYYRTVTRVESSITTDVDEQPTTQNNDDGSRLVKRSASAPIDMFLIDISNEHVLIGQPLSMNIRHLLLDTLENHHINSSTPIRIEPATITTYAHENLLSYIPHVCERYPNVTVGSDQLTRNTLHVRVPSEFSHSLDTLG